MLQTPFGPIRIIADSVSVAYEPIPHICASRSVSQKPLAGCYRITLPAKGHEVIFCKVDWCCDPIPNTGDSGERYLCAEFIHGRTILTIGIEAENPALESLRCDDGMAYRILRPVPEVTFGVAWATDHEDGDVRTWLAADPT